MFSQRNLAWPGPVEFRDKHWGPSLIGLRELDLSR
jgi:hypothetical protein